ncbi:N-acetylmuramoyl-L-alanine amidase CwlD [Candidatus Epulonipiscium fishelsonii]|uniref:N-acetylmuramoyl-L-alanine amidase CwlD n=1 Tax=Candidatus Epulonipiscium fishelsonii TaxID=77094 RepID=A0ACC8X9R2_9FIRM|nr:N-acetylmuramoyl-L-alanine amidase CwlD [Epulopiscium sp. SCG-B05WGA-EpuloA1]ONI38793.1 N-acetylmuramoyl-L-alanine amidase CwlD [Epulopiscium sp. SCG-B11WGA-EpuloA1]ONI47013.1 N-acetylmuramoyl-L-alanine amidase CwlD [Epulopiscium sp. SCG-C06WGA-EpuloA1]
MEKKVKLMSIGKTTILTMMLVMIVASTAYLKFASNAVNTLNLVTDGKTVVIDPGHGGYDPGKVGLSGIYEKDINLSIAHILREYLEKSGATVVMTRDEDEDLDGIEGKFSKKGDMNTRKEIINDSDADLIVSIHQNAFTQSNIRGAQVFYYNDESPGKLLAQLVQKNIKEIVDNNNTRQVKPSEHYYILRTTDMPSIIIECGFLTHVEEEKLLMSREYQDKLAFAIYKGIVEYFQQIL